MNTFELFYGRLVREWASLRPDVRDVIPELEDEFGHEEANRLASQDIVDMASQFLSTWPIDFLAQLSPKHALYYSGSHLILVAESVARQNGHSPIVAALKEKDPKWMLRLPGEELISWWGSDKGKQTAETIDLEAAFILWEGFLLLISHFLSVGVRWNALPPFMGTTEILRRRSAENDH